ncbi:hypothetical protein [Natrialba swarupiae]|uniref:Uncharacterized protein n=1 Tax=Natrialba swarupiae TaxID=2448032 RepID=A0A5D5AHI1_9EURY|nr:hypothetical protein [Natrialba swarupiae]TYT61249.1 hypothetical protein FYC77_14420 [Natrialba swarupiae]
MKTVSDALETLAPRSVRASLQFGIAALGAIVILGSLVWFAAIFVTMPKSDSGFAEGLAIGVGGLYVVAGFVVLSVGLLIPQHGTGGIRFSRGQRTRLAYGAIAPIVSVLLVPIGATVAPPLTAPVTSVLVAVLGGLLLSGPLATLSVVGGKARECGKSWKHDG